MHDITERVSGRARLSLQARTDQLTGLANRFALLEALNTSFGHGTADVLMFVDLDRFKIVNDSLGHEAGDAVIAETGRRLIRANGTDDFIARLGGDEFAVVLRGPLTEIEMTSRCEQVLDAIREPYGLTVDGATTRAYLGVSLGLTCLAGHTAPATAMREADLALYRAKQGGRDRFEVFDENLRREVLGRLALEEVIRAALDGGRFAPYLQPIVRLVDGVILGHEIRLHLPQDDGTEELPPGLMEVAEESGLVVEIDKLTLRAAVQLLTGGDSAAGALNVKISARTIQHPGFADTMAEVVLKAGADGHRLGIELTEQLLLADEQMAAAAIALLHAAGVRVGLDRFGRGDYAFAKLRSLNLDFVKIDRSFIAELANDEDAARGVLKVFFDIGTTFDFEVIATSVDTARQAETLLTLGCRFGQGEALGRALPVSEDLRTDTPVTDPKWTEHLASALVTVSDRRASVSGRGL